MRESEQRRSTMLSAASGRIHAISRRPRRSLAPREGACRPECVKRTTGLRSYRKDPSCQSTKKAPDFLLTVVFIPGGMTGDEQRWKHQKKPGAGFSVLSTIISAVACASNATTRLTRDGFGAPSVRPGGTDAGESVLKPAWLKAGAATVFGKMRSTGSGPAVLATSSASRRHISEQPAARLNWAPCSTAKNDNVLTPDFAEYCGGVFVTTDGRVLQPSVPRLRAILQHSEARRLVTTPRQALDSRPVD
jgi:hypothetical protein